MGDEGRCAMHGLNRGLLSPKYISEMPINTYRFRIFMKSICISSETAVGCKKITYEVQDEVYDFVIKVLEGVEPIPSVTTVEGTVPTETTEF